MGDQSNAKKRPYQKPTICGQDFYIFVLHLHIRNHDENQIIISITLTGSWLQYASFVLLIFLIKCNYESAYILHNQFLYFLL